MEQWNNGYLRDIIWRNQDGATDSKMRIYKTRVSRDESRITENGNEKNIKNSRTENLEDEEKSTGGIEQIL